MAEILNQCLKCKCSLSPNDKTSKLLPCLHTMCEDCISGRTDVAEKIKRMKKEKEEKEQKVEIVEKTIKDECDNKTKVKEENIPKTEKIPKTDDRTEEKLEESVDDSRPTACVGDESAEPTETKPASEQAKSPVEQKVESEKQNEATKDEDGEKKADDGEKKDDDDGEKKDDDGEKKDDDDCEKKDDDGEKKDDEEGEKKDEDREKKDNEEKNPAVETDSEKHEEEKTSENSNTTPSADDCAEAGVEASASEEQGNADTETTNNELPAENIVDEATAENPNDDGKEETETSLPENQPSDENSSSENRPNPDEESMEVVEEVVKEEDPPPPSPVPLTECPICREPFNPETLIDNVFIRKQAATGEDGQGTEQKCTGCETNPATSYCLQCDDWLCADCVNAHKRVRMTKDHQLTSLEEAVANKGSSSGPVEVSMMCRLHPKEKLTLFCERCEVLTCRDCQLLQHQEHKYQFLQEAADTYKAKLTGSLSLMKDRREVLRRYQTEIEERLFKVKREKSDLQQDILKQADVIVRAVRQAVWTVLSSLHSFTDAAAKRLSREVGDVRDLVGKFDHCISFMDGILEDGFGLPLLYSKTIVETKCRKVYHTHMEPQSLKGQLNIQYRHDVPSVLRSLPHIGAIYVNGSKYPPEKSSPQAQSSSPSSSSSSSSSSASQGSSSLQNNAYRGSSVAPVNSVVGGGAGIGVVPHSQGLSHHLVSQDRNLYMQMMMSRQSSHTHTNTAPSQGPTLSLPGSRRVGNLGPTQRGWGGGAGAGQQLGLPGANQGGGGGLMVAQGMLAQGQSQMMAAAVAGGRGPPAFTPMRLHHRPVEPNHMGAQPTMVLGGPLPQQHRQQPQHVFSALPAPPPLRSPMGQPQQYRGAADGLLMNSGGQAAMSGVRRSSSMIDSNPDPARPASGGHNTPERPLSSEGLYFRAASSMRVKSEPQDSLDCVITSASFRTKKSTMVASSSLGELQKNLDEVIRGVPLDLGDNLEQINGADSLGGSLLSSSIRTAGVPSLPLVTSPGAMSSASTTSSNRALSSLSSSIPSTSPSPSTTTTTAAAVSSGETRGVGEESVASLGGGADPGHVPMETDGHQVKGYATGNSMPGFTLAAVESADPNDDYCASCHQGGDVLCCDKCPRVFHLQCHVPVLSTVPSGTFVCTLCEEGLMTEGTEDGLPSSGKRKSPSALADKDLKVCERVLLEMYCHPSSIPFHEPVNRAVPNYYKIITHPMDFSTIKSKLAPGHFDHYTGVVAFLDDCRLVFHNCAVYNSEMSEVGKAGKIVRGFFERLVDRHMPEYGVYIRRQQHESPEGDGSKETERKKRRLTPPPAHSGQSERLSASAAQQ